MEEWRDVVGFEEYFQVSDKGRVYSKRTNKVLKLVQSKKGYLTVPTKIGGKYGQYYTFKVHRLVAESFLEPPSEELEFKCAGVGYGKPVVRHLDGDKTNNAPSNLAWGTYQDNSDDYKLSGKSKEIAKLGLDNIGFKCSTEEVEYIIKNYLPGDKNLGARALSRRFGVSHPTILRILKLYS